jgi:type III restriction enzyme
MELKPYQQKVIADLETFLEYVNRYDGLDAAFRAYWRDKGATRMEAYKNNVPRVPHVCVKVPTAGGKTFIAANALRPIFDSFARYNPAQAKVVCWLVPSLTILEQTQKNLNDPRHPYRMKLNTLFNGRVKIFQKKEILQGTGFTPDELRPQLSIIVLSFDSLRARNKEDRKIFQDNPNLAPFTEGVRDRSDILPEHDDTALINVLRLLHPVLVVDESHNAESDLSVEMLRNLNPSFILDLTATPKKNSNIISYVSALELKKHQMVKLPVIVHNQRDKTEVLESAILLRRKLEMVAQAEEAAGGEYIRPIALLQAQPRTGEDTTTFSRIKEKLIELNIPEEQIKIKTADTDELKGVDLLSRDCPVRYIVTVNALKEGWDCPFAYVLASLANKSSAVDVEQILGRVLRQPYVRKHDEQMLNMSYVFTASSTFLDTLNNIVKGLNNAGFSARDYRAIDATTQSTLGTETAQPILTQATMFDLSQAATTPAPDASSTGENDTAEEIDISRITLPEESDAETNAATQALDAFINNAIRINEAYEQQAQAADAEQSLPVELEDKMNKQLMKEIFAEGARGLRIPQFFIKIQSAGGFFEKGENLILLEPDELLKEFRLSQSDIDIQFDGGDTDTYAIDIESIGGEDYKPSFKKLNEQQRTRLNEFILGLPPESRVAQVNARFCQLIGDMYPIADREIKEYVRRILAQMSTEQLRDCLERDIVYGSKIKQKIRELASASKEKLFSNYLDVDKITVASAYSLPEFITPSNNAGAITKSLYINEQAMNNFEQKVINEIANLENVHYWHKNIENKGFRLNGFINHYPDFIVRTRAGKILLVESKGDDRDNSDSVRKSKLGQLWAGKAGNDYRYMMVFDNNPIDDAYRLTDAVRLISQM